MKVTKTALIDILLAMSKDVISNADIRTAIAKIRGTEVQPLGPYNMALYEGTRTSPSDGYWSRPTKEEPRYLEKVGRGKWSIVIPPKSEEL